MSLSDKQQPTIDDDISSLSDSDVDDSASASSKFSKTPSCSDMVLSNPLYYVLGQFFETPNGKSIATLLEELIQEIRLLRTKA
jgi:hypothetical protein